MNTKVILIAVVAILVIILILVFALSSKGGSSQPPPVTGKITIWGVWPRTYFDSAISSFTTANPGIVVNYLQIDESTYQDTLLNTLASGSGPDIFMLKNIWAYKYLNKLYSAPQNLLSQDDLKNYFNIVLKDFYLRGSVWAMPATTDVLMLFYNQDIFNAAGILNPPKTWDDVVNDAIAINNFNKNANANIAGVALGGANNITYAPDILSVLSLQSNKPFFDSQRGLYNITDSKSIFNYYLEFTDPSNPFYSWNESMANDLSIFSQGKVAMVFAYLRDKQKIQQLNPRLNFQIAPLPQQNPAQPVNYANYWAFGVWRLSLNPAPSWSFLKFLTTPQAVIDLSKKVSEPPAQKSNAVYVSGDIKTAALQALTASDVFTPDGDKSNALFKNALGDIIYSRKPIDTALQQLQDTLNALIKPTAQ